MQLKISAILLFSNRSTLWREIGGMEVQIPCAPVGPLKCLVYTPVCGCRDKAAMCVHTHSQNRISREFEIYLIHRTENGGDRSSAIEEFPPSACGPCEP